MHSVWTRGLRGAEKKERVTQVLSYQNAFDELREAINTTFRKKEADREYGEDWMQRQIAINEYNAALDHILKLIDLQPKR